MHPDTHFAFGVHEAHGFVASFHGFTVQADFRLDPALSATAPRPVRPNGLTERRSRLAQAAAATTTQRDVTAPTTSAPAARPIPPRPSYAPTVHLTASGDGRAR
ncbi:hypothetical protein AB0L33_28970 [Streptomyces sp. NPDC052299]|uniref:hypothetical protein n=1 Tax=Streptomyces sp. NPDC052299 TaxID=3155054 RepID=UPI0034359D13